MNFDVDDFKEKETIIDGRDLYLLEPLKENVISFFYDTENKKVNVGIYYKYNEYIKRHMAYNLFTGDLFFTKNYLLKSVNEDYYRELHEMINENKSFYHNLKCFYSMKVEDSLKDKDKESFLKYSKLYKNLKNEMECLK